MNHTVRRLVFVMLRQGDGNAFDHLFRRYYPMLCAYAHRFEYRWKMPKGVQEVMLWLWENRGDLIIECFIESFVQNDLSEGLEPLAREQVKTRAELPLPETQAALCEVDYARFENWTGK